MPRSTTPAAAVDAAQAAFGPWSQTDPAERARLLDALGDAVAARHDELAPLIQAETGATWKVSNGLQLTQVVDRFHRYARGAMESTVLPLPPQLIETTDLAPGGVISAFAARRPVGVVLAITSYNFPLTNMAGKLGPALAAGNPVIVKPAPQDPLAILKFAEIARDVGFPDGVINVVVGRGHRGRRGPRRLARGRHDQLHRLHRRGPSHRLGGGGGHDPPAAGARRQGGVDHLRRRRRGPGDHGHRLDLGLPLRPDLHGPDPGPGPAGRL